MAFCTWRSEEYYRDHFEVGIQGTSFYSLQVQQHILLNMRWQPQYDIPHIHPTMPLPRVYVCSSCGYEMFSSLAKYEHHTPWPAFKKPVHLDSLTKIPEEGRPNALKVSCGRCGNGLGHEFLKDRDDGGSRF